MLLFLNIILVVLTLGSNLSPFINPDQSWFISILGLGYPALLLSNVIAVLIWLTLERRCAWISFVVLIIGYQSCNKLITFSLADPNVVHSYTVGSYNVNFSKPIAFSKPEEIKKKGLAFETYLSKTAVDILCVQEHGWRSEGHIRKAINYPYVHKIEGMTVAIYSKYPFVNSGVVDFQSNIANTCLWVDVVVPIDTIRIYSAHLESNRHDGKIPDIIEQEAPEAMSNKAILGLVKHYQKFSVERVRQAQLIQEHKTRSPYAVIICGDINDTPQTRTYQVIRGDMQDTFLEEGTGIGSTFGEKIPALRIDYIFASPDIEVLDHEISRNDFSDHYLVIAKFVKK